MIDKNNTLHIDENFPFNIVLTKDGVEIFKGLATSLLDSCYREKYRFVGYYVKIKYDETNSLYRIVESFPRNHSGAAYRLENFDKKEILKKIIFESSLIFENAIDDDRFEEIVRHEISNFIKSNNELRENHCEFIKINGILYYLEKRGCAIIVTKNGKEVLKINTCDGE